jgi:C1A family cysteine protease
MSELLARRTVQKFGWKRDLPDHRDFYFSAPMHIVSKLPKSHDLRSKCPPVYDQGQLGSCTGNAIAAAIQFDRMQAGETPDFMPSRLFIYWNERVIEHTTRFDAGASIRDGIKAVRKIGVCPEDQWPYSDEAPAQEGDPFPAGAPAGTAPPQSCFETAQTYRVNAYRKITQHLSQMKGCIVAGFPFVFGFTVYESFESNEVASTGEMPLPSDGEKVVGGHAVMAVGFDDRSQNLIVRNSWGTNWGQNGYFLMPYAYALDPNLANDFWTIRSVTE